MTLRISRTSTPLLHEVIPLIDILTKLLDKKIIDTSLPMAIRAAVARGRAILNKYYSLTDDSIMYRMAMSE